VCFFYGDVEERGGIHLLSVSKTKNMVLPPRITTFNDSRLETIQHLSKCEPEKIVFKAPPHFYNRPKPRAETMFELRPMPPDNQRRIDCGKEIRAPIPSLTKSHPLH